ncbi:16S rRNA (adenine(1518)-N(6)/adenine(1519)-N(6))-dimethyltransferase RsmA [bacterium]|nr:16S rRNA (adenine(1518)-N(6)/adenine(1519)-N(6))-dimethyltransferase RsmA [bacterium]
MTGETRPDAARTRPWEILREKGVRLKDSLGQNLLIDPNLARKIVDAADLVDGDHVLEIGPGLGALTALAANTGANVWAVDIDARLVEILHERFAGEPRVRIEHRDALEITDEALFAFGGGVRVKVLSNLPYYASSPFLLRLADWRRRLSIAVVMLQRELADRVAAPPGGRDYGILSVRLQAVAEVEPLFGLPSSAFYPPPRIASKVLSLDFRKALIKEDANEARFARVVRAAFGKRRKTLSNALKLAFGEAAAKTALAATGIDGQRRAETLSVEEFINLSEGFGESR